MTTSAQRPTGGWEQPGLPGLRRGIADERWGWPWMFDVVRAIRPRYVLVENVAALLRDADAFGWVLRDLAELGFDAQWDVLSACAVGAPHPRERVFLVAHADRQGLEGQRQLHHPGTQPGAVPADGGWWATEPDVGGSPDGISAGLDGAGLDADAQEAGSTCWSDGSWEDGLARVAHGVPARVDRLRGLGNAVVPQVGEHIGRLILAHAGVNR
jgi:DNA (cytosine-5)-methyltransferase 1